MDLRDYYYYSENYLRIKTKINGIQPLILREYQKKFRLFYDDIVGPKRIYVLKPRQAGFSTLVASIFAHQMFTSEFFKGIAMADKSGRTEEIANIYGTFLNELPLPLKPMISKNNSEQIFLDNPKKDGKIKGLNSGISFETALDPNAGRSTSRLFAHLSEAAFYRYASEIDEGVQNSIPLHERSVIIKESTANGRAGIGKAFYDGYNAAKRGDSAYKAFFVSWFEIDDYRLPVEYGYRKTPYEIDLQKRFPTITDENLAWRRFKILEINQDEDNILPPEERFKQDFPIDDIEAFLSTGAPVFDAEIVDYLMNQLNNSPMDDIKHRIQIKSQMMLQFFDSLTIYSPPRAEKIYSIGADVSEGLAIGDSSSVIIFDHEFNQVASWHGKIDPDLFGHLLISLSIYYNGALLVPENNNMGHTTVTTIRNEGYGKIYREITEDKITKKRSERYGWRTTEKSKDTMLNKAVKYFRDGELKLKDRQLIRELGLISREENGRVNLNGKDRTVAMCLAIMGVEAQSGITTVKKPKTRTVTGTIEENFRAHELKLKRSKNDIFG